MTGVFATFYLIARQKKILNNHLAQSHQFARGLSVSSSRVLNSTHSIFRIRYLVITSTVSGFFIINKYYEDLCDKWPDFGPIKQFMPSQHQIDKIVFTSRDLFNSIRKQFYFKENDGFSKNLPALSDKVASSSKIIKPCQEKEDESIIVVSEENYLFSKLSHKILTELQDDMIKNETRYQKLIETLEEENRQLMEQVKLLNQLLINRTISEEDKEEKEKKISMSIKEDEVEKKKGEKEEKKNIKNMTMKVEDEKNEEKKKKIISLKEDNVADEEEKMEKTKMAMKEEDEKDEEEKMERKKIISIKEDEKKEKKKKKNKIISMKEDDVEDEKKEKNKIISIKEDDVEYEKKKKEKIMLIKEDDDDEEEKKQHKIKKTNKDEEEEESKEKTKITMMEDEKDEVQKKEMKEKTKIKLMNEDEEEKKKKKKIFPMKEDHD